MPSSLQEILHRVELLAQETHELSLIVANGEFFFIHDLLPLVIVPLFSSFLLFFNVLVPISYSGFCCGSEFLKSYQTYSSSLRLKYWSYLKFGQPWLTPISYMCYYTSYRMPLSLQEILHRIDLLARETHELSVIVSHGGFFLSLLFSLFFPDLLILLLLLN